MLISLILACGEKLLPHGPSEQYQLLGVHESLACAACHGLGEPKAQPTACIDCHTDDLPLTEHPPPQECSLCHDEWDWGNVLPTVPPTGTDTGTTPGTTPPEFVHPTVAPDDLCWACHEETRSLNGDDHHTNPADPPVDVDDAASRWDCAPCHTIAGWAASPIEHPIRVPHGTKSSGAETDAASWVIACTDCHPVAPPAFDCAGCHAAVFDVFPHTDLTPDESSNSACLGCHRTAEK